MHYKQGLDNKQQILLSKALDEYIPQNSICRVIHAYTKDLNMNDLGYKYAKPNQTGNRPYNPKMMLNLYSYGYLHRVRSSRHLQAETTKNLEVMWLLNELTPDDKTIANFRADNTEALKQTFRAFTLMINGLDLYGKQIIASMAQNSAPTTSAKTTATPPP